MQRHDPKFREHQLIRESCATVAYHYPEYTTYQDDLRLILNNPTRENWLLAGKVLKHMNNYHRMKFLKMRPDIFADIDLFTLMVCAFIPEDNTAEFAMKRVPQLRNEQEYKKLLTVIPDKDLESFIARANEVLPYTSESEAKLELQPMAPTSIAKDQSSWHPVALITVFAAYYWLPNNFSIAWPILSSLCALYFARKNPQPNTQSAPAFTSLWAPASQNQNQISDSNHHSNCLLQ